jgi:hypothetical protein
MPPFPSEQLELNDHNSTTPGSDTQVIHYYIFLLM